MKTVYIPAGETVRHESIATEMLVVKGCLEVEGTVRAKRICGDGVIIAGSISADIIRAHELEASTVICKRLLAERVCAASVIASESAAVSCYLSAAFVKAGRLAVAACEINRVEAEQEINLPVKKRSLFGTLLASAWRAIRISATMKPSADAQNAAEAPDAVPESPVAERPAEEADFELQRFVSMFKLARGFGYTLKLVPGTPESNAPVFDFDTGDSLRPAA